MALKDHVFFFVVAACCASAATAWTVCEHLRVSPLSVQLQKQLKESKSSPEITRVTTTNELKGDTTSVKQVFSFHDPEGDAKFLSYVVVQTNADNLSISSSSIFATKDEQIAGTTKVGTWSCGTSHYYVTLRAIITDAAGNASAPSEYTINCGT
jgi:hypothetical protein